MAYHECSHCQAPNARACVCGQQAYCSTSCQRTAWPTHKMVCPLVSVQNMNMVVNRNFSSKSNQVIASVNQTIVLEL